MEDGRVETPWRGVDILDKPDRFSGREIRRTTVPGTVSGRVIRKGNPAIGLEIALVNWKIKPAITDSDGKFLLKDVTPGQHAICWRSRGSSTWTYFMIGGSGRGMCPPLPNHHAAISVPA